MLTSYHIEQYLLKSPVSIAYSMCISVLLDLKICAWEQLPEMIHTVTLRVKTVLFWGVGGGGVGVCEVWITCVVGSVILFRCDSFARLSLEIAMRRKIDVLRPMYFTDPRGL